jgi:hypothetical protein
MRRPLRQDLGRLLGSVAGIAALCAAACCLQAGTEDAGADTSTGSGPSSGTATTSGGTAGSTSGSDAGACGYEGGGTNGSGVGGYGQAFCENMSLCIGDGQGYCELVICPACSFADGKVLAGLGADAGNNPLLDGLCERDSCGRLLECLVDAGPSVLSPGCAAALTSAAEFFLDGG